MQIVNPVEGAMKNLSESVELDLSTPEKLSSFENSFERRRLLQPEALMDFGNFVREFQRANDKKDVRK